MSAVAETSFFCPKNVGFSNPKLGPAVTRTEKLTDCGPRTLPSSHLHALIIVQLESALLYHTAELMAFTITF